MANYRVRWKYLRHEFCIYETLRFVNRTAADCSDFIIGEYCTFEDHLTLKDDVFARLVCNDSYDDLTSQMLHAIFVAWSTYLKRALAYQLPGGKYASYTLEEESKLKSFQKHNKFSERIFDNLLTWRPNASILANEAFIIFTSNTTADWLDSKGEEERMKIVTEAGKVDPKLRTLEIQNKTLMKLKQKQLEIERKEKRILKESNFLKKSNLLQMTFYSMDCGRRHHLFILNSNP